MKKLVIPFLILALISFENCQPSSSDEKVQVLRDADKNCEAAYESKDINRVLSFYDEYAFIVKNPPIQGKDNIRRFLEQLFSLPDFQLTWQVEDAWTSKSEDIAYTSGSWQQQWTKDGKLIKSTGRYLGVWRKQKDGTWKVLVDMNDFNNK